MSVFDELSPIYAQIVAEALKVAPTEWERLWLDCECGSGMYAVGGYFERSSTNVVSFVDLPNKARSLVYDAWKISSSYNDRWSTAVFRVDRPGKLNKMFGHEDLDDESVTTVDRERAFRSRTFGDREITDVGFDMTGAVTLANELTVSSSLLKSFF